MPLRVNAQRPYAAIIGNATVRVRAMAAISTASFHILPLSCAPASRAQNVATSSRQNSGSLRIPFGLIHMDGESTTHKVATAAARLSSSKRIPSR